MAETDHGKTKKVQLGLEEKITTNSGVILVPSSRTDYLAGTLPYKEVCSDWRPYLPDGERQAFRFFDSMACVSFSAHNCVETQLNYLLTNNLLSPKAVVWFYEKGYIVNGKFNLSDRFTAKMSGTTHYGNYCTAVWDSLRHNGVVPEATWPASEDFNWDNYYSPIPQSVKDLGLESLKWLDFTYETLFNGTPDIGILQKHLKHAPLQVTDTGHALENFDYLTSYCLYDSYNPFIKENAPLNCVFALKGLVSEKIPLLPTNPSLKYFPQARDVALALYQELLGREPESTNVLDAHATKLAKSWLLGDHEGTRQVYRGFKPEIYQRAKDNQL